MNVRCTDVSAKSSAFVDLPGTQWLVEHLSLSTSSNLKPKKLGIHKLSNKYPHHMNSNVNACLRVQAILPNKKYHPWNVIVKRYLSTTNSLLCAYFDPAAGGLLL